jgi:hypothetical protein
MKLNNHCDEKIKLKEKYKEEKKKGRREKNDE